MTYDPFHREWFELGASDDGAKDLWSRFTEIKDKNQLRLDINRFYRSLYHDRAYQGFNTGAAELFLDGLQSRLNENVIARIVQMLAAKLARQKPKPAVLTDGGDWALQQRAKKYDKFIWGVMHESRVFSLQRMSDLDMLLTGTGAIYAGSRRGKIFCENVPSDELFVDASEARYGSPRTLYRQQFVDRRLLAKLYTKHKKAIQQANSASVDDSFSVVGTPNADMVAVVTGWRLPSYKDAGDGKVVVAIDGTELSSGDWNRERFPFAFSRYFLPPEGFWGIGQVGYLVGAQLEHNRTLAARQEALRRMSAPHLIVEKGTVQLSHLSNEMATIWEIARNATFPPQVFSPNVIAPETFQHGDRIKSGMFSSSGVSEMAAQSMKPAGLNSGKAIRAYSDMMDDALHDTLVRREQQILDLAEIILDEAEELDEAGEFEAATLYVGPFGTQRISFSDAHIARDSFVLHVQPTSSLSTTLSGKLEDLQDMKDLGIITDPSQMVELLQLPDLERAANRINAMRDLLLQIIEERILGEGESITPEPSWDLALALKLAIQARVQAQLGKAPEDRIELLRIFETNCIYYQQLAQQSAPPSPDTANTAVPAADLTQPPPPDAGAEQPLALSPEQAGAMPAVV